MYQQPAPMYPAGGAATGLYTTPQTVTTVPVQGQTGPVHDATGGVPAMPPNGGTPMAAANAMLPNTTATTMPVASNATYMPTATMTTAAAPVLQQQYLTAPVVGVGYTHPPTTGVAQAPVAGAYGAGYGAAGGGYGAGYGGLQQNPSVVVVESGRRRHRSHSSGRHHHHHHHGHSHGRHGLKRELRHMAEDVIGGGGLGHGRAGYGGYAYDQNGDDLTSPLNIYADLGPLAPLFSGLTRSAPVSPTHNAVRPRRYSCSISSSPAPSCRTVSDAGRQDTDIDWAEVGFSSVCTVSPAKDDVGFALSNFPPAQCFHPSEFPSMIVVNYLNSAFHSLSSACDSYYTEASIVRVNSAFDKWLGVKASTNSYRKPNV
ncbi:hypothetical protein V5O48_002765 [Marasmius crinis-equi]|uniref:Uncharacterized protein n=1 Tax=Marasmius crinis-equi TaxID=585013 RepID=A0ABR3FV98_9AGAR